MKKYITVILFILILCIIILCLPDTKETFDVIPNENYSWCKIWTKLDYKARESADCNPIRREYKDFGNMKAWVWIVPKSCEHGLPHTRGKDIIAIPENHSSDRLAKTMEHEKIHIYQRQYPKQWMKFYNNEWLYQIYDKPPNKMPEELIEMRRSNPDTSDTPWCCWNKVWWSVPIYPSKNNLTLAGAPIVWWNQETEKTYKEPPQVWLEFFGDSISQIEHPHEISAVLLSGVLFNKNTTDKTLPLGVLKLQNAWNWDKKPVYPNK